ncbi:MAG: hypothetical protein A3H91_07735 [Gammaproteobacteria bacterium RIFCSPLOWO2_02_FULL_61_13]|nr:MAG: hypothetical protein A3H91_07735 [Gammaproteobacteria bacterium RIFCSPLOWO2_02_FULL_61_13]
MQTHFTPAQLADPDLQSADAILRRCVHCGFCNATCPTYQITGDELDGPRGRIYLIKGLLEGDGAASNKVAGHLDRCLSCLACMTTCPSGVNYMHLIDQARPRIVNHAGRDWPARWQRGLLARLLPHVARFRLLLVIARHVIKYIPLPLRLRPLRELLQTAPPDAATPLAAHHPATAPRRGAVALLAGCVQQVFGSEINLATVRLLNRAGYDVDVIKDACCGAIAHHLGHESNALAQIRTNATRWSEGAGRWQAIIVNASGCGTMLKDYAYLLRNDPGCAAAVATLVPLFKDISEFMAMDGNLPPATAAPAGLRIISQAPCSLRHGQLVSEQPRQLLQEHGFIVIAAPNDNTCCGSAGTYNLLQPELAETLGRNKAAALDAAGGDVIASGNLGCMMQIGRFSNLPRVHTVQLLDWASGGPRPSAIANGRQTRYSRVND